MTPGRRGGIALGVVASGAFAIAAHLALVEGIPPAAGAMLCLVPLAGFATWGLKKVHHRLLVLGALMAAGALLWRSWSALEQHFPDIFFVEHVGANLALAFIFGRTLRAGREPLVTRLARLVHGLTPELLAYTRKVTIAWTLFFLTMVLASSLLYAARWMAAWSLLANIVNPLLVGAMFVVEYAIRHRMHPELERIGILGGIRAFSRHFGQRAQAPR